MKKINSVLNKFAPLFTVPSWNNALVLAIGAILCIRQRTVAACLRVMGLKDEKRFTNFHRLLNRAKWESLQASKILLGMLIALVPENMPLTIVIDETIERRKGKKIKQKGCYRDAVRSSGKHTVKCFGLKWIAMMLVVPLPWSKRPWALPFLTVLAPSKDWNHANGKRHKTTVGWALQMTMQLRRWLPSHPMILIGDGAYAAVALALCCAGFATPVTLVSRLQLNARLFDFPQPGPNGKRGPAPKKGKRQLSLEIRSKAPFTQWYSVRIPWYNGKIHTLEYFSGISLWHTNGLDPVPIKWVVTRDPLTYRTEAFFCTDIHASVAQILSWFVLRWNIEVTFEDLHAHMGFETQRQWSDLAIIRSTPALFGLYSLVVLTALDIIKGGVLPTLNCAWYQKTEASFSDVIALVRRHIWSQKYLNKLSENDSFVQLDRNFFETILEQVCYGT